MFWNWDVLNYRSKPSLNFFFKSLFGEPIWFCVVCLKLDPTLHIDKGAIIIQPGLKSKYFITPCILTIFSLGVQSSTIKPLKVEKFILYVVVILTPESDAMLRKWIIEQKIILETTWWISTALKNEITWLSCRPHVTRYVIQPSLR